jgi:hypothetical protein
VGDAGERATDVVLVEEHAPGAHGLTVDTETPPRAGEEARRMWCSMFDAPFPASRDRT